MPTKGIIQLLEQAQLPEDMLPEIIKTAAMKYFEDNIDLFESYFSDLLERIQRNEALNNRIAEAIGHGIAKMIEEGGLELLDLPRVDDFLGVTWDRFKNAIEESMSHISVR